MNVYELTLGPKAIVNQSLQAIEVAAQYIGKPVTELRNAALSAGWSVRQMSVDGKSMIGTADYVPNRLNIESAGGLVTKVVGLG